MSNLLVIMSDEHQARAMGCAGHPFVVASIGDRGLVVVVVFVQNIVEDRRLNFGMRSS